MDVMSQQPWKPNVTVAAIVERDGRFLVVEEDTPDGVRFNQPAGHLDEGESLLDAAVRETLEETAYPFTPQALVGIYRMPVPEKDLTYLRFSFCGEVGESTGRQLDTGIRQALWLTLDELRATQDRHRSPLVLRCVEDYLAGHRHPLSLLTDMEG